VLRLSMPLLPPLPLQQER
jgi:hypothetical protein